MEAGIVDYMRSKGQNKGNGHGNGGENGCGKWKKNVQNLAGSREE